MNLRDTLWHHAVLVLLLVGVVGCTPKLNSLTEKLPVRSSVVKLPPEVTDWLGEQAFLIKRKTAEISDNKAFNTLVDRVHERIKEAARGTNYAAAAKQFDWEVKVFKKDTKATAFALPGGKIGVYTGLFQVTKEDEDKLAAVLAHEVVHALARHGAERIDKELQRVLVLAATSGELRAKGLSPEATAGVMVAMGLSYEGAIIRPFSRQHESEADYEGLILMARAGYDPLKAISFWKEMKKHRKGQVPEFLSAHPSDDKRIEQLEQWVSEALTYYTPRAS